MANMDSESTPNAYQRDKSLDVNASAPLWYAVNCVFDGSRNGISTKRTVFNAGSVAFSCMLENAKVGVPTLR